MAESDLQFLSIAMYYLRERHWRHAIQACQEAGRRYGNDPLVKLLESLALIEEDRQQEALRELESLRSKPETAVASLLAMAHAQRRSRQPDQQAIRDCESAMRDERKRAGERALLYGGIVTLMQNRHDKAKEYVDRMLKASPNSVEALALRGWIELGSKDEAVRKASGANFDKSLEAANGKHPDALIGKATYLRARRNFSAALEVVNQAIVAFPRFLPALIEKMRVQLELQDWDQMLDTAARCLEQDVSCIPAMEFQLLNLLCREGNYTAAASSIGDLLQAMDRFEPKNIHHYCRLAGLLARVAPGNGLAIRQPSILQQTGYLQERALALDKDNAELITRMGHQLLMQGKVRDALKTFRRALDLDETSVAALQGIIRCQLAEDLLQEAASQLEFLKEVQSSLGSSGDSVAKDLSFLLAVLARKKGAPPAKILGHLDEAIKQHFASFKGLALGPDYYHSLNPDFLIQLVHEYLNHAPQKPSAAGSQHIDPVLRRCTQLLDPLTRAMPGLLEGLYLMARIRYLLGDNDSALAKLETCVDNDPSFSAAFILKAQILLHQGSVRLAEQALDNALSHNFEVRESPLYHLMHARVLKGQDRLDEAIQGLQSAVKSLTHSKKAESSLSSADKLNVYLELAEVYRLANQPHEATKILQDAQNDFAGTPEEVRVTISNADLALQRGDIELALGTLRTVTAEQPYFTEARRRMADIYLAHRKDKRLYAACYRELADKMATPETDLLLADAYMAIQEPEKAIEIYESVLKRNHRDAALATKMGLALVKCHNYKKAVTYYEHALKSGQSFLRFDLGQLLLRLKQFDKAEKTLAAAGEDDNDDAYQQARLLHLRAQVHTQQQNRQSEAANCLSKAKTLLAKALRRGVESASEDTVRQLSETVHLELARAAKDAGDQDTAKQLYAEAGHSGGLELVRLLMGRDELDSAQQFAMRLVAKNAEDDRAVFLLAELLCQQGDLDQACYHYRQLLKSKPDNWPAVAKLVDCLRRLGRLEEADEFVPTQGRQRADAGYSYCRGLREWYCGSAGEALRHLNRARVDTDFQQEAVFSMVEICINPDNRTLGGELFDAGDGAHGDAETMGLRTADRLLLELKPRTFAARLRCEYLKAMVLVASKQKQSAERAVQTFSQMLSQDKLYVPAIYGLAAAHMVNKNSAKARSTLKPLVTVSWSLEFAEELEKGWLLLADMSVQSGGSRSEGAQELLNKVLQHNKACYKAYEYLGFLMEKEQNYRDAARNYELAWKYSNKSDPAIGYKLAFNYLKSKKLVDAVDVCHIVLKNHPTYPKIRRDILDKARAQIRA